MINSISDFYNFRGSFGEPFRIYLPTPRQLVSRPYNNIITNTRASSCSHRPLARSHTLQFDILSFLLSLSLSLSLVPISLSPFRDASLSLSPLFFSLFRFSIYPVSSSPLRTQGSPSRAIPSSLHGVPRPTTIPSPRTISYTVQPTRSLFQPSPSSPARISIVCTVLFRSPHLGEARPRYAPLYNSARNFGNDALWCIRRLPSYFEFLTNRQPLCEYREFKLICL